MNIVTTTIKKIDPRKVILGRCSCVGKEILSLKEKQFSYRLLNQQKSRFDVLINWIQGEKLPQINTVQPFVPRKDIFPLLKEQEELPWLNCKKDIEYCIFDTFSELTDKKFTHKKEGWSFCCHYSDIQHVPDFDNAFICEDLLDEDKIFTAYDNFVTWFSKKYPTKMMYAVKVPTSLDSRELYKRRSEIISDALTILSKKNGNLIPLSVPNASVRHHSDDDFPYHFSQSTYYAFLEKWNIIRDAESASK